MGQLTGVQDEQPGNQDSDLNRSRHVSVLQCPCRLWTPPQPILHWLLGTLSLGLKWLLTST